MLSAEEGRWERRVEMMSEPLFWAIAIPLFVLWFWWDRRAEKKLGREFTAFERAKRHFVVTMAGLLVAVVVGLSGNALRGWL